MNYVLEVVKMGFREWWNSHNKFRLFIYGALFGVIIFFASFYFEDTNLAEFFWVLSFYPFCKITLSKGEGCAIAYAFVGWIFMILAYGGITTLCWILIQKIRRK